MITPELNTDRQVSGNGERCTTWRRMMEYTVIDDWGW